MSASRPDLAEKEKQEADFLSALVPAAMPLAEVDSIMQRIVAEQGLAAQDPKRSTGILLKTFFSQVDKSAVDGQIVKERARAALVAVQSK